jgi:hypothetical protein
MWPWRRTRARRRDAKIQHLQPLADGDIMLLQGFPRFTDLIERTAGHRPRTAVRGITRGYPATMGRKRDMH